MLFFTYFLSAMLSQMFENESQVFEVLQGTIDRDFYYWNIAAWRGFHRPQHAMYGNGRTRCACREVPKWTS